MPSPRGNPLCDHIDQQDNAPELSLGVEMIVGLRGIQQFKATVDDRLQGTAGHEVQETAPPGCRRTRAG